MTFIIQLQKLKYNWWTRSSQVSSVFILPGRLCQVVDVDVEEGCEDPSQAEDGEGGDDVAGEVAGRSQTAGPHGAFLLLQQERILGERQHWVVGLVASLLALTRGAAGAGAG